MSVRIQRVNMRRATALVLVIVLLALLAIMGSTFVLTTRVSLQAVKNQVGGATGGKTTQTEMKTGTDGIIAVIQNTLAEDLWGRPENSTANATTATANNVPFDPNDSNAMNNLRLLDLPYNRNGITVDPRDPNDPNNPNKVSTNFAGKVAFYSHGWGSYFLNEPWDAPTGARSAEFHYYDPTPNVGWVTVTVPVDGDPWLASTDTDPNNSWPRGSDVFRVRYTDPNTQFEYWPREFSNIPHDQIPTDPNALHAMRGTLEKYADADGDGYLDSVWLAQKGFFNECTGKDANDPNTFKITFADTNVDDPEPKNPNLAYYNALVWDLPIKTNSPDTAYRMAVRIIDTSGLVNVNTAWGWFGTAEQMSLVTGEYLGQVGLYGKFGRQKDLPGRSSVVLDLNGNSLIDLEDWQMTMDRFQNAYAYRIEDPDWAGVPDPNNFYPIDLSDELQLRSCTPASTSTLGQYIDVGALRTNLTAYGFSRNIRREFADPNTTDPNSDLRFPAAFNLRDTLRDLVGVIKANENGGTYNPSSFNRNRLKLFVRGIRDAFARDTTAGNYADNINNTDYHTWQYIANLVDYLDIDRDPNQEIVEVPTVIDTAQPDPNDPNNICNILGLRPATNTFDGSSRVYGLEQHPVITEIAVTCDKIVYDPNSDPNQATYTYSIHVEVGNPWPTELNPPSHVHVVASGGDIPFDGNIDINDPNTLVVDADFGTLPYASSSQVSVKRAYPLDPNTILPLTLSAVSYRRIDPNSPVEVPEDTLSGTIAGHDIPIVESASTSLLKVTDASSPQQRWKALCNRAVSRSDPNDPNAPPYPSSLGKVNTVDGTANGDRVDISFTCAAYATSSTATLCPESYRDPNNTFQCDSVKIGTQTFAFARLRSPLDLGSAPYVGYSANAGIQKGIGDCLMSNDNLVHFDFTDWGIYADTPTKSGVFRDRIVENFRLIDRGDDGIKQLSKTATADTVDELRLPGLINVNTAPSLALQALHPLITNAAANNIRLQVNKPYKTVGEVLERNSTTAALGSDPNNTSDDFFVKGLRGDQDVVEKASKWSRIANLITTRSDTFAAYILIEELDRKGNVVSRHREVAIFDRSMCNQPPLVWNTNDSKWIPNPKYVAPKVVARQVVE